MSSEIDPKLASLLDAELKKLPPVKAPATLAPRIMAVLAARAHRPWWAHAWWDWPLAAKATFILLALALLGAVGGGGIILDDGVTSYSQQMTERLAPVTSVGDTLLTLGNVVGLLWEKAAQPFLLHVLVAAGLLYLTCLGLGTACVRYALKRA